MLLGAIINPALAGGPMLCWFAMLLLCLCRGTVVSGLSLSSGLCSPITQGHLKSKSDRVPGSGEKLGPGLQLPLLKLCVSSLADSDVVAV